MPPFIDLNYFFSAIYNFFAGADAGISQETLFAIKAVSFFVSIFFIYIIIYALWKTTEILAKKEPLVKEVEPSSQEELKKRRVLRWQAVRDRFLSDIPSDWRIGVLEADIMLEEALKAKKYEGENLGERLKKVESHELKSLDKAWQAHRIRNEIVHEADREITKIEVNRAIADYDEVLRELDFI